MKQQGVLYVLGDPVLLSVSSNGSNWVKLGEQAEFSPTGIFQYPRTDRIG